MSLPETKVTKKVTGNQKKILELLEENPEISQKEIGELWEIVCQWV